MLISAGRVGLTSSRKLDPRAVALIAAMNEKPNSAVCSAISYVYKALDAAGLYNKFDWLSPLPLHTQQAFMLNWKNPSQSMVAVNSPGYTPYSGTETDGVSSYFTVYNPFTYGGVYTQNSAHLWFWNNNNAQFVTAPVAYANASWGAALNPRSTANQYNMRINNSSSNTFGTSSDSIGFFSLVRSSSTARAAYKNGVVISTAGATSSALWSDDFEIGRNHITYLQARVSGVGMGGSLTDSEMLTLYNIINTARSMMGAL